MLEAVPAFVGITLAIICIVLVYNKSSKPLYNIPKLIVVALLADVLIIFVIYLMRDESVLENSNLLAFYMPLLTIANLILMISGSSAISLLVHPKLSGPRIMIHAFLVGFAISSSMGLILAASKENEQLVDFFVLMLSLVILFGLILWAILSLRDLKKAYFHGRIGVPSRTSPWMVFVVIVIVAIIPLIILTLTFEIQVNNYIISLNGVVLAIMAWYFSNEERLIFLFPSRHNLLLISDYHGSLKYSYNFALMPVGEGRESLLAGWLTSISHILSEFFDQEVRPREIKLDENRIYIHWADHYLMAFITDQQSSLYLQALNQLGSNVNKKFGLQVEILFSNAKYLDLKDVVEAAFDFI